MSNQHHTGLVRILPPKTRSRAAELTDGPHKTGLMPIPPLEIRRKAAESVPIRTSTAPSSPEMPHLHTLNDDVLLLIIKYLDVHGNGRGLHSLSCANRHLRQRCAPWMFRDVVWTWDSSTPEDSRLFDRGFTIPAALLGHIKALTFRFKDTPETEMVFPFKEIPGRTVADATHPIGTPAAATAIQIVDHVVATPLRGVAAKATNHLADVPVIPVTQTANVSHEPPRASDAELAMTAPGIDKLPATLTSSALVPSVDTSPMGGNPVEATTSVSKGVLASITIPPSVTSIVEQFNPATSEAATAVLITNPPSTPPIAETGGNMSHLHVGAAESINASPSVSTVSPAADAQSSESHRLRYVSDVLSTVLPNMSRLQTFHFQGPGYGPWRSLLQSLSLAPALERIHISGQPWRRADEIYDLEGLSFPQKNEISEIEGLPIPQKKGICRFKYSVPFYFQKGPWLHEPRTTGRRDETGRAAETPNLSTLLTCFNLTLTHLEIPADIIDALYGISFPQLQKLRVNGPAPNSSKWIIDVLAQAPELLVLHLDIPQEPLTGSALLPVTMLLDFQDHFILPPLTDTESGEEKKIEENVSIPSNLQSLTLSSPSPSDRIFQHLPATVAKLSFPSYPSLYQRDRYLLSQIPTGAISTTRMLEVLKAVACPENITHLDLSYNIEDFEPHERMISYICTSFTGLKCLEIHSRPRGCLPGRPETGLVKGPSTIDLLEKHLPKLSGLSQLKLNADFPDLSRFVADQERYGGSDNSGFQDRIFDGVIRLAEASPTIRTISILKYGVNMHYWDVWDIARSPVDGKLTLTPPAEDNIYALWLGGEARRERSKKYMSII